MRFLLFFVCLLCIGCQPEPADSAHQILAFGADWCARCVRDEPRLAEIEAEGCRVIHINADERPDLIYAHQVLSLPTYVVYRDGQQTLRTTDVRQVLREVKHE